MVRKLAGVGAVTIVVAVLLGALGRSLALSAPLPGQPSFALLQFAVGLISAVLVEVGAILIALAALAALTRRAPLSGHPARLIWLGLALVLASVAAEAGAWWITGGVNASWTSWIPLELAWALRWVGSGMVAVWLAGRLSDGARVAGPGHTPEGLPQGRAGR